MSTDRTCDDLIPVSKKNCRMDQVRFRFFDRFEIKTIDNVYLS